MSDQPLYRWLDQQGEAFGAPGLPPRWTSSVKDAVGTAYSASSRVWFTCSHGILNEIYHPTIDSAQVRDMEFLITDGETFVHEEKRDLMSTFEYIHPEALGVRYINRDPDGRYTLTKEIICDPHHSVVLQRVRLEGHEDLMPRLKVYALLAPHLDGGGAGNTARARGRGRAQDAAGVEEPVVAGDGRQLRLFARELRVCGRERRLAGPDAITTDGLGVRLGHQRQYCGDGRAEPGCARRGRERLRAEFIAGRFGIGEGTPHGAAEDGERAGHAVRAASRPVHRAVAPGGQSRVAGGARHAMAAS